nr:RVT_2 domain-containing protein [Tanacetum cinerariifolium]
MFKKFGLEDSKPMKTPMSSDTKLTKDEECESVDNTKYRCMIDFAQILDIHCEGACVFTDIWSLDELAYGVPSDGPYQTNPPSPDDIISTIRIDQEGQVCRIRHEEEIDVQEYQILTREILSTLKPLEEIIQENVFCLGESYVLYDHLMNPLAAKLEQKPRKDHGTRRGCHPTSSSTFNQPSSSHLNNDDDGNNERTSRAKQTDGEAMTNSIQNDDQPLPVIAQVSLAGTAQNASPTLKDPKFWTAEEKKTRKIDRLARSLLIQGLPNDFILSLIATKLLKTYRMLLKDRCVVLMINDLKKCGYKKDNCELNYKFLNNLQLEWKQYDPLALVAEKTKVSKHNEKVEVQTESEGSDDEDISDLKKITAL